MVTTHRQPPHGVLCPFKKRHPVSVELWILLLGHLNSVYDVLRLERKIGLKDKAYRRLLWPQIAHLAHASYVLENQSMRRLHLLRPKLVQPEDLQGQRDGENTADAASRFTAWAAAERFHWPVRQSLC